MFSTGDCVIDPGLGLCTVVGFEDNPNPVLVLETGEGNKTTRILYPIDFAQKNLRYPVGKEEALSVIASYDSIECDDHHEHNSGLEEQYFKKLMKRGVPHSVMVAKTMKTRIEAAEAAGKKPSSYYIRVLREARRRSFEELSFALGVTPDDVEKMFENTGSLQGDAAEGVA